jgi:hypothetical protein
MSPLNWPAACIITGPTAETRVIDSRSFPLFWFSNVFPIMSIVRMVYEAGSGLAKPIYHGIITQHLDGTQTEQKLDVW